MLFIGGGQTRMGRKKHIRQGVHAGATSRIQLNDPCWAAMRAIATITVAN